MISNTSIGKEYQNEHKCIYFYVILILFDNNYILNKINKIYVVRTFSIV